MRSIGGNPYEARTLKHAAEQGSMLAEECAKTTILDRGNKGADLKGICILRL